MEKNIYCWNECIDKDTGGYIIMEQIVIRGEVVMFCHACNKAWELDFKQAIQITPHWQKQQAINNYLKFKEQNPELYSEKEIVMEKNIYCWSKCMQEDVDSYVIMKKIMFFDREVMFCPACCKVWELNHDQIPPGPTYNQRMKGISRHMIDLKENPQDYED